MSNPFFDIIKNINKKDGLLDEEFINLHYSPFGANRIFARTEDGLVVAEYLNRNHEMTKYEQYRFYYHQLRKNPRRFGERIETNKHEYIEDIMEYFNFSKQKAIAAMFVLSNEDIEEISKFRGGKA